MAGTIHETLTGDLLHVPGYVSDSDPGAVGAGKLWIDINGGAGAYRAKVRNEADDGWEEIGVFPGPLVIGDLAGNGILLDPVNGIYLYGSAVMWDDLRFPATNLCVNPATLKPDFDYTEVGFLFDAAATETIFAVAQMPHGYKEGSDIEMHIHWEPTNTNTGNVLWQVEYKWTNIGGTEPGTFTAITILDAGDGTAYKHQIADFATISGTGKTISSILSLKISRLGGDGTDTYNADALLKEFDIHYQINSFGSDDEYVKGP